MEIVEIVEVERIQLLKSKTKKDVISELLTFMNESLNFADKDSILKRLYHREELMSTGVGLGIAIPHIRCAQVSKPMVAIGISPEGIVDYESIDGELVFVVVMIIAGEGQHRQYIKTMSAMVRCLKEKSRIERLRNVKTVDEAYSILVER